MTERAPLLNYRLFASCNESAGQQQQQEQEQQQQSPAARDHRADGGQRGPSSSTRRQHKKLNTFFGVVVPTLLSMFSVVVFLRIGFMVGHCGLYQAIAMYVVAYFIITMTVLSVCAISTNGALDAGGAYCILQSTTKPYMISRALGPEFGGSIGLMFFLGNVCASALFVLGLVEAIVATFGMPEGRVLPSGYWWSLLYGTAVALVCLLVCLVGANIYASATFIIFLVVIISLATVFISFFAVSPHNLDSSFSPREDGDPVMGHDRQTFLVAHSGPNGAPSQTLLLHRGAAMTPDLCSVLLQRDYSYLSDINVWPPFVTIGVYSSTLSAAMSSLIGASRILYALAKDDLFDLFRYGRSAASLVLFAGKVNTIAGIATIFFLLVYAAVDLACLALEWASAPNFRKFEPKLCVLYPPLAVKG
ncbi:LOW QUALITY PROTEIN: hypothetical protein CRUP_017772 [Coryphaenoides rupestris]|nr:LOW QUALITY PROTEIN: hypothetical protein CRUP_017772 [Coryphaenoides rupestris]